jgi:hypothetical protein
MFPSYGRQPGWLYLVGGHDGIVKVGRTTTPRRRAQSHRAALKANFAWVHLFGPGTGEAEYAATRRLADIGTRSDSAREVFCGVSKKDAIAACRAAIAHWTAVEIRLKGPADHRAHLLSSAAAASYSSATCSALRPNTVQTALPAHS